VTQPGDAALRRVRDPDAAPDVHAEVVVIAAGPEEVCVAAERDHVVEADHVAVEAPGGVEVVDVQVDVAHHEPGVGARGGLWAGRGGEQVLDVERDREHADPRAGLIGRGPPLARAVRVELDAVAVGVAQIEGLRDAVVGGARQRRAGGAEAQDGVGERGPVRGQQGEVVEAGVAARGAHAELLVQDDEVSTAGAHRSASAIAALLAQADCVLVEADGAIEVRDREMDGSEAQRVGKAHVRGRYCEQRAGLPVW